MSSAPNVAITAKRNKQIAAPCLTTNLIISAESSLSVSDSSQRPVSDILRVRERTEDAGFDSRCPFSFTASRFVRVRQLAYGYGATTLSFSRPTAAPDWPTSSWAARAEQVVRRAGCHVLVVRENEREFVRNTKRQLVVTAGLADVD